jgi:hypothetical protein
MMHVEAGRASSLDSGVQPQLVPVTGPDDIGGAFAMMARESAVALIVFPSGMLFF